MKAPTEVRGKIKKGYELKCFFFLPPAQKEKLRNYPTLPANVIKRHPRLFNNT